jgi:two-component system chemotaxis response regulator CheB
MPESALAYVHVDHTVSVPEMGPLLGRLARCKAEDEVLFPVPEEMILEQQQMTEDPTRTDLSQYGTLSSFTCPECSGPIWERRDGDLLSYRCRVGHAFTASDMIAARAEQLEQDLWATLNRLEESIILSTKLAQDARARGYDRAAASFDDKAIHARRRAELIHQALRSEDPTSVAE